MQVYSNAMLSVDAQGRLSVLPTEVGVPRNESRNAGFIRQNCRIAPILSALLLALLLIPSAQADPLDCWTRSHQSHELFRVMFTDGLWIAVGYDQILTSGDGSHWTNRFLPASEAENSLFLALARGNGMFVTAGILYANGTGSGVTSLATSADGLSWTRHDSARPSEFLGMAYGNGTFVAVGETVTDFMTGNAVAAIFSSPDGITWTDRTIYLPGALSDVTFANGLFVAVGVAGAIVTSANGADWSVQYYGEFWGVTYGAGLFVAVGPAGRVVTSIDGTNWVNRSTGQSFDLTGVAYGAGRFVAAVMPSGHIMSSTNAIDWRVHSGPPFQVLSVHRVAYGAGTFVGVNENADIWQSASLLTGAPPTISVQPQDQVVYSGTPVSLSVAQAGCSVPTFQWFRDSIAVGSNSPVLTFASASLSDSGNYSVVLLDTFGGVTSRVARLEVLPSPSRLVLQGSWPGYERGPAFDVVVASNRAYVAMGPGGLAIFDVSDPGRPVRLGCYLTSGKAIAVQVVGNYAYVIEQASSGPGSLEIVDVTDPTDTDRVGIYEINPYSQRVQVVGGYAYIAAWDGGLQIVDVSDPTNPVFVGAYVTNLYAFAVDVVGNYAYVTDSLEGLHVINLSNPTYLFEVGRYGRDLRARDVRVMGNYAYMTVQTWNGSDYAGTLEVLDVSNPANPVRVAATATTGAAERVQLQGNYAYVVGLRWSGPFHVEELDIFDVSNPVNPVRVGGTRVGPAGTSGNVGGFYVLGNYAYVAAQQSGWQVIDVRKPAHAARVSGPEISGSASDVQVVGHYAYVADSSDGLQVIDVSDSNHPVRVGGYITPGFASRVHLGGNYAYVSGWRATSSNDIAALSIFDVSQPTNPVPVSIFDTGIPGEGSLEGIHVVGSYAYLVGHIWNRTNFFDLAVLDVSDPANPAVVGVPQIHFIDTADVQAVGNYAYVVGSRDGPKDDLGILHVFDISNPTHPLSVAGIDLGGEEARALQVVGDYAYVADYAGLTVVNVSNPRNPVPIGAYETYSSGLDVHVVGGYAYLLTQDLKVLDVNSPSKPMLADQFHRTGDYDDDAGLDVIGNHAYVADTSGLTILEITQLPYLRSIARLGDKINLSWNGAPGLKLQHTTTLSNSVWTDVPNSEGQSSMEMPLGNSNEFFRLVR